DLSEQPTARAANDDLGDVFELGEAQNLPKHVATDECPGFRTERFGKLERLIRAPPTLLIQQVTWSFDGDRDPRGIHQIGKPLGVTDYGWGDRIRTDTGENAFAGRPGTLDRLGLHALDEIGVDPLGGAPQCQLAQRREVLRLEKVLGRARRGIRYVDFSL